MNFNKYALVMIAFVGIISVMMGATTVSSSYAQANSTTNPPHLASSPSTAPSILPAPAHQTLLINTTSPATSAPTSANTSTAQQEMLLHLHLHYRLQITLQLLLHLQVHRMLIHKIILQHKNQVVLWIC